MVISHTFYHKWFITYWPNGKQKFPIYLMQSRVTHKLLYIYAICIIMMKPSLIYLLLFIIDTENSQTYINISPASNTLLICYKFYYKHNKHVLILLQHYWVIYNDNIVFYKRSCCCCLRQLKSKCRLNWWLVLQVSHGFNVGKYFLDTVKHLIRSFWPINLSNQVKSLIILNYWFWFQQVGVDSFAQALHIVIRTSTSRRTTW